MQKINTLSARHPPQLIVSLHDVSPQTWPTIRMMLRDLRDLGIHRTSLLVVPNHHYKGHFLEDAGFCRKLKQLESSGHEIVAHGYYHLRARKEKESLLTRAMTRFYTADEGEFYDLSFEAASELLQKGKQDFQQLFPDDQVRGFIAPAWLLGKDAYKAVKAAGFHYTTRIDSIQNLKTGKRYRSRSLVYSCRNRWRRIVSLQWNGSLFRTFVKNKMPLLRIGLHPPDYHYPSIWRQVRLILQNAHQYQPTTYKEFVSRY